VAPMEMFRTLFPPGATYSVMGSPPPFWPLLPEYGPGAARYVPVVGCGFSPPTNCAATAARPDSFTEHAPEPVQEPPHPRNVEPLFGWAVSTTMVPAEKVAVHFAGQAIPGGLLTTPPLPRTTTANVGDVAATAGVAAPKSGRPAATANRSPIAQRRRSDVTVITNFEPGLVDATHGLPLKSRLGAVEAQ
jgi:hypothetical protein